MTSRPIPRLAHRLIGIAAKTALLLVAIGYGGAFSWVLDGIGAFRLHLALAAAVLLIVTLGLRFWRMAGISLVAAVLASAGLGPVLKSPLVDTGGSGPEFVLVYANLFDANPVPDAAARALLAVNADVLVTSETTAPIANLLRQAYPHRVVYAGDPHILRTAIWSRFPLDQRQLFLDNTVAPTAAAAQVDLGQGNVLHLAGVHFSRASEGLRQAQTDGLARMGDATIHPRIIIGDFNAAPWSWTLSRSAELTNTRILGGHRTTWTGAYPTPAGALPTLWGQQIDHMLHAPEIAILAVETLTVPGSDHRALMLRLRLSGD